MFGAKYIHFDVMDGKFVPNISFSPEILQEFHDKHNLVNDVHIMVENPLVLGPLYATCGADIVTFHYEAAKSNAEIEKIIGAIKEKGAKVGISIKPNTKVEVLEQYLSKVDLILVMSVEPGKGGQSFIPSALTKIEYLRNKIDEKKLSCLIEVDGGINFDTAKLCVAAGVDILVAGSYLFNHEDIKERIEELLAL